MLMRLPGSLRRALLLGVIVVVAVAVAIQLIPYGRNHTNPPVRAEPPWDSPQTRAVFMRACGDCHSNETVWRWYSHIAPVSWLVVRDVEEGRAVFNVSEWDREDNEGDEAAELVQEGAMPPFRYIIAHPPAQLAPAERQTFLDGLVATFDEQREDDVNDALEDAVRATAEATEEAAEMSEEATQDAGAGEVDVRDEPEKATREAVRALEEATEAAQELAEEATKEAEDSAEEATEAAEDRAEEANQE
jgi:cbb3-type cytochrome oxidase cytochrome c subunit